MLLRPGEIRILAAMNGAVVQHVAIESDRPVALVGAMAGRPVGAVAGLMASLHGLCGQSHAAAVRFAAAAATDSPPPPAEVSAWAGRLMAERIGEHLRGLFLSGALAADPALVRQAIAMAAQSARGDGDPQALASVLDRLDLGDDEPVPDDADVLRPTDDTAIVAALVTDCGFSRAPALPGRCPQTGPAARFGAAATPATAQAARRAELRALRDSPPDPSRWVAAGCTGAGTGYAAVETPRGRLHYWLRLDADGMLRDGCSLAPTEWNFHPDGPLRRALTGYRTDGDPVAAITAVAAAFDPCVAFRVSLREAPHA